MSANAVTSSVLGKIILVLFRNQGQRLGKMAVVTRMEFCRNEQILIKNIISCNCLLVTLFIKLVY